MFVIVKKAHLAELEKNIDLKIQEATKAATSSQTTLVIVCFTILVISIATFGMLKKNL